MMSIKNLNRLDNVICTVIHTNASGSVVKIKGLLENPFVIMYNTYLKPNSVVMGSISKISLDMSRVKVSLDSVLEGTAA